MPVMFMAASMMCAASSELQGEEVDCIGAGISRAADHNDEVFYPVL